LGLAIFQWVYSDVDNDSESAFAFQIDDDGDFLSPEVNRNYGQVSAVNPGNTQSQSVMVGTEINYNTDYYWRVKVWDGQDDSGWVYYNGNGNGGTTNPALKTKYKYEYLHPAPKPDFTYSPENPRVNSSVSFDPSLTTCYNNSGAGINCNRYLWSFGDDSSADTNIETSVSNTYADAKKYTVRLWAYDEVSRCYKDKDITVSPAGGGSQGLPKWKEISPF